MPIIKSKNIIDIIVYHKNGNDTDFRRENIIICNRSELAYLINMNMDRGGSTSKYYAVMFNKRNEKWQVCVEKNGVKSSLGYYSDEEEAARAYDNKVRELYGESAKVNFP